MKKSFGRRKTLQPLDISSSWSMSHHPICPYVLAYVCRDRVHSIEIIGFAG